MSTPNIQIVSSYNFTTFPDEIKTEFLNTLDDESIYNISLVNTVMNTFVNGFYNLQLKKRFVKCQVDQNNARSELLKHYHFCCKTVKNLFPGQINPSHTITGQNILVENYIKNNHDNCAVKAKELLNSFSLFDSRGVELSDEEKNEKSQKEKQLQCLMESGVQLPQPKENELDPLNRLMIRKAETRTIQLVATTQHNLTFNKTHMSWALEYYPDACVSTLLDYLKMDVITDSSLINVMKSQISDSTFLKFIDKINSVDMKKLFSFVSNPSKFSEPVILALINKIEPTNYVSSTIFEELCKATFIAKIWSYEPLTRLIARFSSPENSIKFCLNNLSWIDTSLLEKLIAMLIDHNKIVCSLEDFQSALSFDESIIMKIVSCLDKEKIKKSNEIIFMKLFCSKHKENVRLIQHLIENGCVVDDKLLSFTLHRKL